jgi:predicted nuclease with TOPRIM domain
MSGNGITWQKLEQAVDRLESALDRVVEGGGLDSQQGPGEAGAQLNAAQQRMQALETENRELRDMTDQVAGRLDHAIDRLRTLLDG